MRTLRIAVALALGALALSLGVAPAAANKRVALVIANGAYQHATRLPNPPNDATAIAAMFRTAGFDAVALHQNLSIREMRRAINEFADTARNADTAVVYYSGHGIEVNGVNYLVPVDALLERDSDVPYETFSLDNLVQVLEPARRLRLVMLDACRDNPFARTMKRTIGTRSIGRGLAAVEPASVNTLIGFAAKAGSFALDGDGANSPYAAAVLNNLATPGLDLRIAFGRVRDDVLNATKNKQEPFVYGSLGGQTVSLVDAPAGALTPAPPASRPPVAQPPAADPAERAWAIIQNNTSIAVLQSFIEQYGNTPYGRMARARLEELKKNQAATATSPPKGAEPKRAEPKPAEAGRIRVTSATLGQNCGARQGNVTAKVGDICNGRESCALPGSRVNNPDPAVGCAKTFAAEWACSGTSAGRSAAVPAIGNETHVLSLTCK